MFLTRSFVLLLVTILILPSIAAAQDTTGVAALITASHLESEQRAAIGKAKVRASVYEPGSVYGFTASYDAQWSEAGIRCDGECRRIPVLDKQGKREANWTFVAILTKNESAIWIRDGIDSSLRRGAPKQTPFGLKWLRDSLPPAWYRTYGRHAIAKDVSEGELSGGRGRVSMSQAGDLVTLSYTYSEGASGYDESVYDMSYAGLMTELRVEGVLTQVNRWTRDKKGRIIPVRLAWSSTRSQNLPEFCNGFEESYEFEGIDLDYRPSASQFQVSSLPLPVGTFVTVENQGTFKSYVVGGNVLNSDERRMDRAAERLKGTGFSEGAP